jgi:hypothetical protein
MLTFHGSLFPNSVPLIRNVHISIEDRRMASGRFEVMSSSGSLSLSQHVSRVLLSKVTSRKGGNLAAIIGCQHIQPVLAGLADTPCNAEMQPSNQSRTCTAIQSTLSSSLLGHIHRRLCADHSLYLSLQRSTSRFLSNHLCLPLGPKSVYQSQQTQNSGEE